MKDEDSKPPPPQCWICEEPCRAGYVRRTPEGPVCARCADQIEEAFSKGHEYR